MLSVNYMHSSGGVKIAYTLSIALLESQVYITDTWFIAPDCATSLFLKYARSFGARLRKIYGGLLESCTLLTLRIKPTDAARGRLSRLNTVAFVP